MKVAVVLTGQVRYIDWCWYWWESLANESQHDITFFSTTWPLKVDSTSFIRLLNRAKYEQSGSLNNFLKTDCNFSFTDPAELIKFYKKSKQLETYLTKPKESAGYRPEECVENFQYHFGRFYQFSKTLTENNFDDYNVIVHSRWDCLVKDASNFDKMIEADDFVFDGMNDDGNLIHGNDWIYKGPAEEMVQLHSLPQSMIDVVSQATEHKDKNWLDGSKFLIGHYLFLNYIKYFNKNVNSVFTETTLFRPYQIPFKYSEWAWKKAQYCYYVDIGHITDDHVLKNRHYR
jgi:hypothetical protein